MFFTPEDKAAIAKTRNPGEAMRMIEYSYEEYMKDGNVDATYMWQLTDSASDQNRKYKPDRFLPNDIGGSDV